MGRQSLPFQLVYFALCAWVAITIIRAIVNSIRLKKKQGAGARSASAPRPTGSGVTQANVRPAEPQVSAARRAGNAEGSVSTQGERPEEHAEHSRRYVAEEAARQQASVTLRELQDMRRNGLRTAVVMSEVLNKPVALRRRPGSQR